MFFIEFQNKWISVFLQMDFLRFFALNIWFLFKKTKKSRDFNDFYALREEIFKINKKARFCRMKIFIYKNEDKKQSYRIFSVQKNKTDADKKTASVSVAKIYRFTPKKRVKKRIIPAF